MPGKGDRGGKKERPKDVKGALRVDYQTDDDLIQMIMQGAEAFILERTGLTAEQADEYPQLIHAYFCLCNDMYDVREYVVDTDKLNPTVKSILSQLTLPEVLIC